MIGNSVNSIPLFLTCGIVCISLRVAYVIITSNGSSWNHLRWAQERRWRENASRSVRIMYLEHDLGLHADRTENCVECDKDKQRALDAQWLGNSVFDFPRDRLTDTVQRAYDSQVAWGTKTIIFPPPPTAQPSTIRK